MTRKNLAPLALVAAFALPAAGEESWPQWRGPERTGQVSPKKPWPGKLAGEHLVKLWETSLAEGYSGPVSSDGRVFTFATRSEKTEALRAFDLEKGDPLWEVAWGGSMKVPFFAAKNGSWVRSTPTIADGAIYAGGMRDVLVKLDTETGKELWRIDFTEREGTDVPSFGHVCSPLVDDGAVYVQAGLAVAKLDAATGTTIWRSMEDRRAMFGSAFSSPLIATVAGKRQLLVQARMTLAGLDLETGKELWSTPVKAFRGMNILSPTVIGANQVFTATYGGGAFLFTIEKKGEDSFSVKQTWNNAEAEGYMGSPIVVGDHIYLHGRDKKLHCLSLATGEAAWSTEEVFGDYWSMVNQGDRILALDQKGELVLFQADPESFQLLDRQRVSSTDPTWAHLGIDGDRLLVRSLKGLAVYRWQCRNRGRGSVEPGRRVWDIPHCPVKLVFSIAVTALISAVPISSVGAPPALSGWKRSDPETARSFFAIEGTGERQNPLRRELDSPFRGDTLFVRFQIRYDAASIDSAKPDAANPGDGEFFVLWLDQVEGAEISPHSGGVPNVGIHVGGDQSNRFMVRYASGGEQFGPPLEGDRDFTIVARLAKSRSAADAPFDELSLWVDPKREEEKKPVAVCRSEKAISSVSWIGFSTARKTEAGDSILVGDLLIGTDWAGILGKAPPAELTEIPPPPAYDPPPVPEKIVDVDPQPDEVGTEHWSFQPLRRPDVPMPVSRDWVRNPIDAFIARKHESAGLVPSPPASAATLARRLSLVLTGLPPGPEQLTRSTDQLAEELLESPAYGERMGRHWLDVARWAESNGHQHNRNRDHAWRYRDWVVKSFAEDKPYDRFLREQIAGDEMVPFHPDQLVATGFLAAARYSGNELDTAIQRNDILVDIVNTTSKAFLGLTMECAQCHDHFFDPITQWDYYHLMAWFAKGQPGDVILSESDEKARQLVAERWGLFESVRSRLVEQRRVSGVPEPVLVIPKSVPGGMTAVEKRTFARIETELRELPRAWAFYSPVTSPNDLEFAPSAMRWPLPFQKESLRHVETRYLDRGEPASTGPVAKPGWPLVFGKAESPLVGTRLELADWLTDPAHPLTARVWVNRIWQWHFGHGLVETSGDFGVAGAEPSHPELLDWLASELTDSGWSTKHIHRLILQSSTFRQGSTFSEANSERDPGNSLLWRWTPRRLEAEAIRDSVLAVAGTLDRKAGGPGVAVAENEASRRRSLYLFQKRDNLPHQQMLFDGSSAVTSCAKRRVSTVGLQPLWMLNSSFMAQQSAAFASRVETETSPEDGPDFAARRLVRLALQREATAAELADLRSLIADTGLTEAAATLLNTNEFLYIP
jgi:outer membrane protein assembly factor BamB